jgi:hypothetical protein
MNVIPLPLSCPKIVEETVMTQYANPN